MSHLIIKPYDNVFTPAEGVFSKTWHGLNEGILGGIKRDGSNVQKVLRPIRSAGFKVDFSDPVSDFPSEVSAELSVGENPVRDFKVLLADLRGNEQGIYPIHVASRGYTVHQNADLFANAISALDAIFGPDGYEIATVGTLGAYSQFFLSVFLKSEGNVIVGLSDKYQVFFNIVSSHNSLVATGFHFSSVRVVCMNTVLTALSDSESAGTSATVRHSLNSGEGITASAMETTVRQWLTQKATYFAALFSMVAVPMTLDGFRAFAAGVFTRPDSDSLSSISFGRIGEMETLFARGLGNAGVSLYDGINAFTEYFTSGGGVGKSSSPAKRLASANFGRGNEWKLEAIRVASNEEMLAETMVRGERFYSDKAATVTISN